MIESSDLVTLMRAFMDSVYENLVRLDGVVMASFSSWKVS